MNKTIPSRDLFKETNCNPSVLFQKPGSQKSIQEPSTSSSTLFNLSNDSNTTNLKKKQQGLSYDAARVNKFVGNQCIPRIGQN